ncbi:hypothetical protein RCL1_003507 [Eukaryota sp. TZLM3-RCL]
MSFTDKTSDFLDLCGDLCSSSDLFCGYTCSLPPSLQPFVSIWNDLNSAASPFMITQIANKLKQVAFPKGPTSKHPLIGPILTCLTSRISTASEKAVKAQVKKQTQTHTLQPTPDTSLDVISLRKRLAKLDDVSEPTGQKDLDQSILKSILSEKIAVERDLTTFSADVTLIESMMSDVAQLNSLIADHAQKQYHDAIEIRSYVEEAKENIDHGVVSLEKALKMLKKVKYFPFVTLTTAALLLLYFDWIYP